MPAATFLLVTFLAAALCAGALRVTFFLLTFLLVFFVDVAIRCPPGFVDRNLPVDGASPPPLKWRGVRLLSPEPLAP